MLRPLSWPWPTPAGSLIELTSLIPLRPLDLCDRLVLLEGGVSPVTAAAAVDVQPRAGALPRYSTFVDFNADRLVAMTTYIAPTTFQSDLARCSTTRPGPAKSEIKADADAPPPNS